VASRALAATMVKRRLMLLVRVRLEAAAAAAAGMVTWWQQLQFSSAGTEASSC
jgi:hypothetical protein